MFLSFIEEVIQTYVKERGLYPDPDDYFPHLPGILLTMMVDMWTRKCVEKKTAIFWRDCILKALRDPLIQADTQDEWELLKKMEKLGKRCVRCVWENTVRWNNSFLISVITAVE